MRFMIRALALFSVTFFGLWAWAQEVVPPSKFEELVAYVGQLMTAVGNGDWNIIGGFVLMAAMVAVRQLVLPKAKINADHLPLILAAMSGLSFAGLAMVNQSVDIGPALKSALITSGVASLAWDLGGKLIFKLILGDNFQAPAPKLP